jgi:hypothetical protein
MGEETGRMGEVERREKDRNDNLEISCSEDREKTEKNNYIIIVERGSNRIDRR